MGADYVISIRRRDWATLSEDERRRLNEALQGFAAWGSVGSST